MKCDEFELHLNEILDERRPVEADALLREHGDTCRDCRQLASAYGLMLEGFFALNMPPVSDDLAARVLADLAKPEVQLPAAKPRLSRSAAWMGGIVSTAAAVLLAVFLTSDRSAPEVAQAPVEATPKAAAPQTSIASTKTPDASTPDASAVDSQEATPRIAQEEFETKLKQVPLVGPALFAMADREESSDPYADLAKGTGRGLAQLVLRMPGVAGPQGVRPNPAALNSGGIWPHEVNEEFRPVTDTMTETFNLLLDALPLTFSTASRTRAS